MCQIISAEEENAREDELELEDLRKQGIAPLPKPPPGVGLLPTPGQSSPSDPASGAGRKIPSLFEIKVQPTVDLAHKIALRYVKLYKIKKANPPYAPHSAPPILVSAALHKPI